MYVSAREKEIIETTDSTVGDLRDFAEISDLHACAADEVIDAARLITRIEDDLRRKIHEARRELDHADAALTADESINERGVLQLTGTEIDMLAARRADAYARLTAACRTAIAICTASRT